MALRWAVIDLILPGKRLSDAFVWLNGDSSPRPPIEDDHAPAVLRDDGTGEFYDSFAPQTSVSLEAGQRPILR